MGWDPFGDIGDFFEDVGESVGEFAEDVWKSEVVQVAGPAAIGFAVGGPAGAAVGAQYGLSSLQQEKAIEEAEKMQEKQIAAQKEMQEKQIELETLKMEEQKQLMDVFTTQDRPRYITPSDITKPAPMPAMPAMPANYLLYIAIGIGILIYLGKIKL